MESTTYDEVDPTPISSNETYSAIELETEANPSYGLQKTEDIDHHALKGVKQIKSSNTTKFNKVVITMMVILLLTTLISIVLSVTTINHLASEQSKVQYQLEDANNDIRSALLSQLDIIQMNLSQRVLDLDTKLQNYIPLLTPYLRHHVQMHCGQGLWHQLVYLNMSDSSYYCPTVWREYNTSGVRACGRPENSLHGSCASVQYITYQQYSKVCGRIIGYQFGSPDAF